MSQDPRSTENEPESLAEAFRIFNQASEELSTAYTGLQAQVAALTGELAAANGALRQQYQEKAALTERLSLLLSALPAGVVVLDAEGCVSQSNPAAEMILGTGLPGKAWQAIEREKLDADDTPGEYLAAKKRRVAVTVTPLDSAGGRIVLLNDITEAHRLKAQAERHERLAAMGEMAAQLAHQLRTPLAAALLYTANLENPELPAASRIAIAQKAVARLKHLERLIQDMLLFARGEVLGREPLLVADLLQELRQTIEPLARVRQVAFCVRGDSDGTGEMQYTGNRKALFGALTNLLDNALQAAASVADGAVELTVRRTEETLAFSIKDNGPGMSATTVARLFEPFFTTRNEGTGLGLAIARGVARAHGGNIEATSDPAGGSEFVVTLPLSLQATIVNDAKEHA
ncbi:globin-coupled histidine kinase [mine drainage metagenome]|uniref:histidine kinase n=1 Tax=mine drainage metagenome TaxID=410659 RepID=A0A1J5RMM4_9ZZZZ